MACKLYYGNGEVTIEGAAEIRGVEISYKGAITITKSCGDNFHIVANTNKIMVFPLGEGFLNNLFTYSGTLIINSVLVADNNGERVSCIIKRVMDYSELLDSNAEDLTVFSENLRSEYYVKREIIEDKNPIIKNLQTSGRYYLIDGTPYNGYFHVHLNTAAAMTGATHTVESKNLYVKQGNTNKLIHTNKLKRSKRRNKNRRRR